MLWDEMGEAFNILARGAASVLQESADVALDIFIGGKGRAGNLFPVLVPSVRVNVVNVAGQAMRDVAVIVKETFARTAAINTEGSGGKGKEECEDADGGACEEMLFIQKRSEVLLI